MVNILALLSLQHNMVTCQIFFNPTIFRLPFSFSLFFYTFPLCFLDFVLFCGSPHSYCVLIVSAVGDCFTYVIAKTTHNILQQLYDVVRSIVFKAVVMIINLNVLGVFCKIHHALCAENSVHAIERQMERSEC